MRVLLSLLLAFAVAACAEPQTETEAAEETPTPPVEEATEALAIDFPVYTSFSQFEPWLHLESDTTYVVNFWATWCKPCVEELPYFEALTEKYKDDKVRVILVSLDFAKQIESKLLPFLDKHQLQSEVIAMVDGKANSWIDKVHPEWSGAIPITLIYNKENRKFISEQFADAEELENALKEVML